MKSVYWDNLNQLCLNKIFREYWLEFCVGLLILFAFCFHIKQISDVSIWQGEPSYHLALQTETIKIFKREQSTNGHPWAAFANTFHLYPKIGTDIVNSLMGIFFFDDIPSMEQQKKIWSLLCLISFLFLIASTLVFIKRNFSNKSALIGILLVITDQYMLLYSTFPRQNMPSLAIAYAAIFFYIDKRQQTNSLSPFSSVMIGMLLGISSLFHYSAAYMFFFVILSEIGLGFIKFPSKFTDDNNLSISSREDFSNNRISPIRESITHALLAAFIVLISGVAIWAAADIYYYSCKEFSPEILKSWTNKGSILSGFVHGVFQVEGRAMAWKIEPPPWWFGLGFIYNSTNPIVWIFAPAGFIVAIINLWKSNQQKQTILPISGITHTGIFIVLIGVSLMVLSSVKYFACARSIAYYIPFLLILTISCLEYFSIKKPKSYFNKKTLFFLVLISFFIQLPRTINTFNSTRGTSLVNYWLEKNDVSEMYSYSLRVKEPLLTATLKFVKLTDLINLKDDDLFYLFRFYHVSPNKKNIESPIVCSEEEEIIVKALRETTPLMIFPQYSGLPLYWYEFPVKESVVNFNDPLVTTKRIYKIKDLKSTINRIQSIN